MWLWCVCVCACTCAFMCLFTAHARVCFVHSSFEHMYRCIVPHTQRWAGVTTYRLSASSSAQLAAPWPHPKQKDESPCGYLECVNCGKPATPVSLIAPSAAALVSLYAPGLYLHWVISTGFCPCVSSAFLPSPFQPYTIFPVSLCALSLRVFCACSCLFPPSWQSIWRPVEPPTGWHVSAYRLPGCTVAVRPHSGHGAALLHTLELCTPGVPTVVLW